MTTETAHAAVRYAAARYAADLLPKLDPIVDAAAAASRLAHHAGIVAHLLRIAEYLEAGMATQASRAAVGLEKIAVDYLPAEVWRFIDEAPLATPAN